MLRREHFHFHLLGLLPTQFCGFENIFEEQQFGFYKPNHNNNKMWFALTSLEMEFSRINKLYLTQGDGQGLTYDNFLSLDKKEMLKLVENISDMNDSRILANMWRKYSKNRHLLALLNEQMTFTRSLYGDEEAERYEAFQNALKERYPECVNPDNPNVLKCMILNQFFPVSDIIAGHVLHIDNRGSFPCVGMDFQKHCFDARNGLLLHRLIYERYASHQLVSN